MMTRGFVCVRADVRYENQKENTINDKQSLTHHVV